MKTVATNLPRGIAREAFEAWARGPAGYVDDQLARYADGSYQESTTRLHWSIFTAGWVAGLHGISGMNASQEGGQQ